MKVHEIIELDEGWKDWAVAGALGAASLGAQAKAPTTVQQIVKPGETVYSIARQHQINPVELLKLNHMNKDTKLNVGQTVAVPKAASKEITKPTAPVAKSVPASPVTKPIVSSAKAEPAPFNPASSKPILISTAKKMGLNTVNDLSSLLGQVEVETADWTAAAENFNYTDPTRIYKVFTSNFPSPQHAAPYVGNQVALANRALANKNGNGNEASGDGWKYRGRGFIHLTGKELYAKAGAAVHPENPGIYVARPELLSSNPLESAKVAVWYFLSKVGKGKTVKQASKTVNPAGLKSKERGQAAMAIRTQLAATTPKKTRKT